MTAVTTDQTNTSVAEAIVDIDRVSVTFESKKRTVQALKDVDLQIHRGEFIAIVGPSGCGKSTLLRAISGISPATQGQVRLRGDAVVSPRQDVGFIFQRPALMPWRDVRRNIMLQAEMRQMDKAQAEARCRELLQFTGLEGFEKSLPHELSGGMQQRAALCRALLHEPDVLLMDEPFGALDALTREKMNVEIQRLWRERNMTVALVTHSVAEAVYLATRVIVMGPRPGRIIEEFDVNLPRERDYEATMEDPEFHRVAGRVRELLGSGKSHE
ncbi:ABC transporter ATP-binding protein [Nesterenkonia rhizosphaerae]|uniref:ABC transporter ATP-binding protein n=1 Tax=Nesterenkonia rhizosphaerae TaxID=1348272 RepID=A0ABP9FSA0_9MICC